MDTYTGWPCRKTSFLDLIFTLRSLTFYRPPSIECDRDKVNLYTRTKLYLAHLNVRAECDCAWVSRILTFCMSGRLTLFFCLLNHHLKEWRVVVTFPIGILILLILLIRLININVNLQERTNECRQECIDQGELVSTGIVIRNATSSSPLLLLASERIQQRNKNAKWAFCEIISFLERR